MGRRLWVRAALVGALVLLTVAVRWPLPTSPAPFGDHAAYDGMARALADHGLAAVWSAGSRWRIVSSFWPPLWPAWLSVCYRVGGTQAALLGNLVLAVATGLVLVVIGQRLAPPTGWVAGCAWALAAQPREAATMLASENLALPLLLLSVLLALSRRWAWCGFVCGLSVLTRQAALPIVAVLFIACYLRERSWQRTGTAAALCALVLLPWSINRSVVWRSFVPLTTSGGWNLYMGTHPTNTLGGWSFDLAAEWRGADGNTNRAFTRMAVQNVATDPLRYLANCANKASVVAGRRQTSIDDPAERRQAAAFLALALFGTMVAWRFHHRSALLVAACYWTYTASLVAGYLTPRLLLLNLPLACLLGGYAIISFCSAWLPLRVLRRLRVSLPRPTPGPSQTPAGS